MDIAALSLIPSLAVVVAAWAEIRRRHSPTIVLRRGELPDPPARGAGPYGAGLGGGDSAGGSDGGDVGCGDGGGGRGDCG